MSKRFDEARDYAFADQALALRKRTGLTQRELADLLGVTSQSIHTWEAGLSYPGSERLKQLIAIYLERGVLEAGREAEEAAAVWETVRERAPRRIEPFDPSWFASLQSPSISSGPEKRATRISPPTNLVPARTSFIGRSAVIARLTRALDQAMGPHTRLLTLAGVAGCGKTRLALAVAEAVLDTYPDGVWFVELAPLPVSTAPDPTAVAAATLAALRLHEQLGRPLLETLTDDLQSRQLLLVLDGCEHVVAACAAFSMQVLTACPQLQIVTTSQYPLGIALESVWQLDTLDIPPAVEGAPTQEQLDELQQYEAVQLFVERAQAARPGFQLTMETAADIAQICRQLDGLPLAIELAAARLNMLPVNELRARLNDRFRLLRRGGHSVVDRHQTLQATMDWSYRLLEPSDRTVLRRLAVFSGGWELSAAEAVCAGGLVPIESVLEALDELVARSLIHVYTAEGVPRYGMLETVRHYGLQQLHLTGETASVRDRHLAWVVTLAEQAGPALLGAEQATEFARLDREHDNLRAALQWALDRGLTTPGLRVTGGIWKFWLRRGYQREGRHWLAAFLALAPDDDDAAGAARAAALEGAAWLAEDQHDFVQASALFAESGALRRAAGEEESTGGRLINAAMESRASGNYGPATALLEECTAQNRRLGRRGSAVHDGLELSLSLFALVLREQGEFARAGELCEEALALSRELGEAEGMAQALMSLGDIARDQGETNRVRALCEESLARFRDLGHPWGIGFSLNNLALAAFMDGDLVLAAGHAEESEAIFRDTQAGPSLAEVLVTIGRIRGAQGEPESARASLAEAIDLAWKEGPRFVVAAALEALAVEAVRQGHAQYGVSVLSAMAELRRTMGVPVRPADQAEMDHALEEARTMLGTEAFADAWTLGRSLSVEQIVGEHGDASVQS